MTNFAAARINMVEGQIRPNKVVDPNLVNALMSVPREQFVPKEARGIAYVDEDIPLGSGRFLMEPLVLGRLLQAAAVGPDEVVLDVGCGTGYSTAVLAKMAATVVGLETDKELAARAMETLRGVGVDNALVIEGALADGYPAQAPYDVILLGGAVAEVPGALLDQLADGGRLVGIVVSGRGLGEAKLFRKAGSVVSSRNLFEAGTPLLPGFELKPRFVF
ncbi:MAG TPA: protein-L-isoaspartate O-methyltransferase [Azospirillaceae bacterium]|nr:protein-L-isoaspartate O-methyltransferase [Azospirillaceae bacterium]